MSDSNHVFLQGFKRIHKQSPWKYSHPFPADFCTSRFLPTSWFLAFKLLFLCYTFGVLIASIITSIGSELYSVWPVYLTHWVYAVEFLYFLASTINAFSCHFNKEKNPSQTQSSLPLSELKEPSLSIPLKLQWFSLYIATVGSCVVTLVFWLALYPGGEMDPIDINIHLMNSLILVVDQFLIATPFHFPHLLPIYIFAVFYLLFNIIFWLAGSRKGSDNVVYSILDWGETPLKGFIYVAVIFFVLIPVFQLLYFVFNLCREGLYQKFVASKRQNVLPMDNFIKNLSTPDLTSSDQKSKK